MIRRNGDDGGEEVQIETLSGAIRTFAYAAVSILLVAGLVWYNDQLRVETGFFVSGRNADVCFGVFNVGCPFGIGVFNLCGVGVGLMNVCIFGAGLHNAFCLSGVSLTTDDMKVHR